MKCPKCQTENPDEIKFCRNAVPIGARYASLGNLQLIKHVIAEHLMGASRELR